MDKLSCDYETASRADLKKVGADVYARDSSTQVLMLGWRVNKEPVELWLPHKKPIPKRLHDALRDPQVRKTAFNAPFERAITQHVLKIPAPPEQWWCVQVMAHSLGLPGKLETLMRDCLRTSAEFLKDDEGARLMRLFSFPKSKATWETHPHEFERYGQYCVQDVIAECKAFDMLIKYIEDPEKMFRDWHIDQRINDRGIPVDYNFIDQALAMAETAKAEYMEWMRNETGLANPNSTQQLLPWLKSRGYPFTSIASKRVSVAMADFADDIDEQAKAVLKMRAANNKSSLKKYVSMRDASHSGRLRGTLQFMGAAATGRWAGRILGQNLPRPWKGVENDLAYARQLISEGDIESLEMFYGKTMEVLASSIRSAISPKRGKKLVVADLSSIELVVGAWLCGSAFWLDVVEQGLDAYKAFGAKWFQKAYEQITKEERTWSKPGALGCMYRLGAGRQRGVYPDVEKTGLWGYAAAMGISLTRDQCKTAVKVYRELSPEIKDWWYGAEAAAMECVQSRDTRQYGMVRFDAKPPFMRMRLPSGRFLHYCRPKIEMVPIEIEDEETGEVRVEKLQNVTYERLAQQSNKWGRTSTHGGKLLENAVQAIARDVLMHGLRLAEREGLNVIAHYHDEIVCEVDEHRNDALQVLIQCMTTVERWAQGMTVRAAGYENDFYKKD